MEKICTSEAAAKRELPTVVHAGKLFQRLTELAAFDSLADVPVTPPQRRHKLEGARQDEWAVNIKDGWRICFSAVTEEGAPAAESDLREITRIRIDAIEDYHD